MANTPDRELEVFGAVWLKPDQERAAFLDEACAGDAALRQRVEQLLHASQQAGDFLTRPAESAPGAGGSIYSPAMSTPNPGDQIGPYRLGQPIGEGGCGVVYLAEQEVPVRRQVALKVIKLGMDTKNIIARFEAERHVLALMDHPNIARVLDAGVTGTGRPYFVMELVRGIKITDYCDQNNLSTRERLDLFIQVCRAVQHAHQKGIIHRDLKPSNILVTVHDGVPMPKVIDFGIAKATLGKLTDLTVFTAFEQFMGTPAYMSPEQAEPGAVDIDTRSDIYSLGVLLYELLTGQTPFETRELMDQGVEAMRKTIREKEPVRPSTKLSQTLVAAGPAKRERLKALSPDTPDTEQEIRASSRRLLRVKETIALVQGDLDWIVMKALEKDRARRYETATGFAADIQRHINNEPVIARPPGSLYVFQKMVRRHKLVFVAGTIIVLALILGLGAATVALVLIKRAKDEATKSLVLVKQARDAATESLWNSYLTEARGTRLSNQTGQRLTSLDTLAKAAAIRAAPEVRDQFIAALAVSDLRVAKQKVITGHSHNEYANFDLNLAYYAFPDTNGNIAIRAASNDVAVAVLSAPDASLEGIGAFSVDAKYLSARYWRTNEGESYWVWDWKQHQVVTRAVQDPDDPQAAYFNFAGDFSPDGRFFATSRRDGSFSVYELATARERKRLPGARKFNRLMLNPGDTRVACSSKEQPEVEIRDLASGAILRTLTCAGGVSALAWSPDGRRLATAGDDFCIYVWDVGTGARLALLNGHDAYIMSMTFSHAGNLLASTSYDGVVRLWNSYSGRQEARHPGTSWELKFSPDDHYLMGWQDRACYGSLEVVTSHECRQLCLPRDGGLQPLPQFSPDGHMLATGTDHRIHFWDASSGVKIGSLEQPDFDALVFSPDGRSIVTVDRVSGINRRTLEKENGPAAVAYRLGKPRPIFAAEVLQEAAISGDGRRLAVTQQPTGKGWVLDLQHPTNRVVLSPHPQVNRIAISPDGRWVATASFYNSLVKLWDAQTGDLVRTLAQPIRTGVTFSPDGRWLATTSREIRLWKVGSWEPAGSPMPGFDGPLDNFTIFSPDGSMLALTEGHRIQLLETATQKPLAMLEAPGSGSVTKCQFSPDGSQLAAVQVDQQVQLWDLRLIREELAPMHLDWDLPSYPPALKTSATVPVTLEIETDTNTAAP